MEIVIDDDLKAVLEFMQLRIPASKLLGVASGVHDLAPVLWGRYSQEPIVAAAFVPESLTTYEKQPVATE